MDCLGGVWLHISHFIILFHHVGDGGGGQWLVWMEWRPAGWSVCLPLLIFPCTIKFKSSLLAPAHLGGPRKDVKWLWCGGGVGVVLMLLICKALNILLCPVETSSDNFITLKGHSGAD